MLVDKNKTVTHLQQLRDEFKKHAAVLDDAISLLTEKNDKDISQSLRETLAKKKTSPATLTLLIDGSGSMMGTRIDTALNAAKALYDAKHENLEVQAFFWGSAALKKLDLADEKSLQHAKNLLNSGTDLLPSLNSIPLGNPDHKVIIISDGDLFDVDVSAQRIKGLLIAQRKMSIDVVCISRGDGRMVEMIDKVNSLIGSSVSSKRAVGSFITEPSKEEITSALVKILDTRLSNAPGCCARKSPKRG